jgi:opacity protein-like surface antigen
MKKFLSALALLSLSLGAAAQVTAIAEVDYHKYNGAKDASTYWATGLSYGSKYGTFDGYAQGVRATGPGYVDNLHGFEFGYTVPGLTLGSASISPRLAYGQMHNVDVPGTDGIGKYILGSVEANMPLREGLNGFVSVSHMKGYTDASIKSQNRVMAGVDVTLTEKVTARVGYSRIWQYGTTQQGVVTMLFYSF